MNWRADVNLHVIDWPVTHSHLKMGEECGFLGACAILDAADILAEAIEITLVTFEQVEAAQRGVRCLTRPGQRDWRYETG